MSESLPPALVSVLSALEDRPTDVSLRLLAAEMLLDNNRAAESLQHCAQALADDPANAPALELLRRATTALSPARSPEPADAEPTTPSGRAEAFDWHAAESEVSDVIEPAFVPATDAPSESADSGDELERPSITLADVAGMSDVKHRLDMTLLAPMRNPELGKLYGRSLPGGLLLYGPPGCGKTFLARAVAGEMGAHFYSIGLSDILDMWMGSSERNLHEIFETARRHAPCVLFIDEMDAIGQKRTNLRNYAGLRPVVNQLLTELDSVKQDNTGVFVLGATNHPWDVDTALLRPGRFDRLVLVLPPDLEARKGVLQYHLRGRPLSGIDVNALARRTEHFSGADLALLCDSAGQLAMEESLRTGDVRPILMADFASALQDIKPSSGPWLTDARNVALYANEVARTTTYSPT